MQLKSIGHWLKQKQHLPNLIKFEYWIPFITFVIGFFSFVVLSLKLNAFWLNSPFDFPFLTIPSIVIGDSIILPIFNYRFYQLIRKINFRYFQRKVLFLLTWSFFSVSLSIGINTYTHHYLWIHDQYTGFIDTSLGELSIAGWWHYYFSIAQTFVVFLFLGVWLISLRVKLMEAFDYAYGTWKVFVLYSSLSILDFSVRHLFIFKTTNLIQALKMDGGSLLPMVFSLFVLWGAKILRSTHK